MRSVRSGGVTLVELLVALGLLGLVLGVSGLAMANLREPREGDQRREMRRARAEAIRSGEAVRVDSVLFLPDGRAIGTNVDPFTGGPTAP